ncbi:MAG TPA: 3-phosphoserine/phosphohydroxythreonine transaminase [Vicinamibacterales bacterium]|nr:3-phosphoserine/phosphohydroxythreonine transaminase [Vicinamibacterales bacterium]
MSATSVHRIYNFSAGPAVLPLPVLEEAQRDLLALPGVGMSVLEISHRSRPFDAIFQAAEADMRALAGIPSNYKILFLQGGASLQFSMVPMNLLTPGATADYILTGDWGKKALKEARRVGATRVAATTEAGQFKSVPAQEAITLTPGAAYVHLTSNETIHGVEWPYVPNVDDTPLVCDMSSDMYSRPIDIARYGLIYAGAQKNLGPSGLTVVVIREDLLARSADTLPTMLNYKTQAENGSLYNTPPVFGIYILRLVLKWLVAQGGLDAIQKINQRKAGLLYAELDRSGFWRPHAARECRSQMNITFRLPSEELEALFVKESTAAGFDGLKGHRSVGGLRASIYNAFPEQGVVDLVAFMQEFERRHG